MAQVVVLGAGISGHTAALFLRKCLPRDLDVVAVSPLPHYKWIPSNIWVGDEADSRHGFLAHVRRSHGALAHKG